MFEGHHRVGWNSYPNTMALLTGEAAYKPDVQPDSGVFYIDEEFQFIQNTFKENGYLRLHLEDFSNWPNFFRPGLLTCYLLSLSDEILDVICFYTSGYFQFKDIPAEFYYRSAYLAMRKEHLLNSPIGGDSYSCLQEKMVHKHQFNLLRDFIEDYQKLPTFSFVHLNELLHDSLTHSKHYDQDLANVLGEILNVEWIQIPSFDWSVDYLFQSGALDKTFLFTMSDHGPRAEVGFQRTQQGEMEQNTPLLTVRTPPGLARQHPAMYKAEDVKEKQFHFINLNN